MKLITKEIAANLPPLGATDGQGDETPVPLKLFAPVGAATWYVWEYDPAERIGFGLCFLGPHVGEPELGYVSVDELERLRLPLGLKVERDLYWSGTVADAKRDLRAVGAWQ